MSTNRGTTTADLDEAPPAPPSSSSSGESLTTVVVALTANVLVAVAKTIAALFTGSASMVAEAAHSWADTGNEVFLLIGERRSHRPPDPMHPFGYGRSSYVWSMFAAFGLFSVGSALSIWHGLQALGATEQDADYTWAYAVLGVSVALEGTSFAQSVRQTRDGARTRRLRPLRYLRVTSDPMLRAVFAEDFAALVGLVVAATGLALHQITGNATWDAVGAIIVGILLGIVAITLIARNSAFLTGEVGTPRVRDHLLRTLLTHPDIDRVSFLHTEWVGPDQLLVIGSVDMIGDPDETTLQQRIQNAEDTLEHEPMIVRALLGLSKPDDTTRLEPSRLPDYYEPAE